MAIITGRRKTGKDIAFDAFNERYAAGESGREEFNRGLQDIVGTHRGSDTH